MPQISKSGCPDRTTPTALNQPARRATSAWLVGLAKTSRKVGTPQLPGSVRARPYSPPERPSRASRPFQREVAAHSLYPRGIAGRIDERMVSPKARAEAAPAGGGTPASFGVPPRADYRRGPGAAVNPPLTRRSNVACANAPSPIPVRPRFSFVGSSGLMPRNALVGSTSIRCPSASSSACTLAY
jgi:hypothetical protein